MFTICHSNHLDLLEKVAAQIIQKDPLPSVFVPEIFVVQSQGMAKWLQVQLAIDLAIAANFSFVFPGQFIWQMYSDTLPDIPEKSAFDREIVIWKLLQLLPDIVLLPEFSILKHYLKENEPHKYYSLARVLADLYDSYLMYRPEWIMAWERGQRMDKTDDNELWQAKLWNILKTHTESLHQSTAHRAAIYQHFVTFLQQKTLPTEVLNRLPKRVFIFGMVSLPPVILSAFALLGKHIDVYFMFTNPCRWYWGEIPDEKWLNKLRQKQWRHQITHAMRSFVKPATESHPLLALLGKLGRDTLFLLQEYEHKNDIELFTEVGTDTLLHQVQQHILDLTDKAVVGIDSASFDTSDAKHVLRDDDFSISFHSCHSPLREVEVLYNDLLHKFNTDSTLSLRDVIVMVPDIDVYAPAIKAVFGSAPPSRYLPFSLCDQTMHNVEPGIQAFLFLLSLPSRRFTLEEVFDVLSVPAVFARFGLSESDLDALKEMCIEAGVRWGLDDTMLLEHGLGSGNAFTWQFGLERLLLGTVMQEDVPSWQGIVPLHQGVGLSADSIGKMAAFIEKISYWYRQLQVPVTLSEWQPIGTRLIEDFFVRTVETEPMLILVEKEWQKIINEGHEGGYTRVVPIAVLEQAIQSRLLATQLDQRFFTGKINFCTLLPMRGIPFEVVCLLGMNEGAYPRLAPRSQFDLIAQRPKRGDRSRREDDHYLFLEAVLSAQRTLYVSYIGKNIVDNRPHYASVLIDALRDYISQAFVLEKDKAVNIDLSAQNVKDHLTRQHPRTPYHPDNYDIHVQSNRTGSYMEEWYFPVSSVGQLSGFVDVLPPRTSEIIAITDLKSFYRHSVKTLLHKRLGVFYPDGDATLPTAESFTLEGLMRFSVNQRLLDEALTAPDRIPVVVQRIKGEGKLPYGVFGELALIEEQQKIAHVVEKVQAAGQVNTEEDVHLIVNGIRLEGRLEGLALTGLVRAKPGKVTETDGIVLWIDHLITTLLKPNSAIESHLYGFDDTKWSFDAVSCDMATAILSDLITGFLLGMTTPLLLPVKGAWAWLEHCYDSVSQQINIDPERRKKGRLHLRRCWQGNPPQQRPECDVYYARCFSELTEDMVDQIEQNATRYLLPMKRARSVE